MGIINRFFFVTIVFLISCSGVPEGVELLHKAEQLGREGKADRAIELYRIHIEDRLKDTKRPAWENPYFYLLSIGDLYLQDNQIDKALLEYEQAENKGIETQLVADRYRFAATRLEEQGKLKEAIALLEKYREKDPLLFNIMLDRIARRLSDLEDQKR